MEQVAMASVNAAEAPGCAGVDWAAPRAVASVLALTLLNIVVITGNGLVIAAIATSARLRTTTHLFIGSLAAADLLVGILVMPFSASLLLTGSWLFGPAWCSVWLATDVWCCTASILNLCAISLDRFLAVTKPVMYPTLMSTRRARSLVAAVWFVAFIIALPPLMGQKEEGAGPPDALCPTTECRLIGERGYVVYSAVGSFFLPCLIMLFFYWRIYRAAASTARSISKGFKTIDRESWRSVSPALKDKSASPSALSRATGSEKVTLRIHRGRGSTYGAMSDRGTPDGTPSAGRRSRSAQNLLLPAGSPALRRSPSISPVPLRRLPSAGYPNTHNSRSQLQASRLGRAGSDRTGQRSRPHPRRNGSRLLHPDAGLQEPRWPVRRVVSERSPKRLGPPAGERSRSPSPLCRTPSGSAATVRRSRTPSIATARSCSPPEGVASPAHVLSSSFTRLLPPVPQAQSRSVPASPSYNSPDVKLKIGTNKLGLKAHARRFRVETKAAKTLAVLIGVFVLCWLPFFTLYLARPFCERCFSDTVFTLCFWLGYCNSAINPALYACFSLDFRTAFKHILRRLTCCAAEQKHDSAVIVSYYAYGEESSYPITHLPYGQPV